MKEMKEMKEIKEMENPENWKKAAKKAYAVYMCKPLPNTECTNYLEDTKYVTDEKKQFILSGTVGETWVIDVNKLSKTYTFDDGTPITPDTLESKKQDERGQIDWTKLITKQENAEFNWAFQLPKEIKNYPIKTSWGDTLIANRDGIGHLDGDFLVCADADGKPNLDDMWVVNGEVFPRTYNLDSFTIDKATNEIDKATNETKYPLQTFITYEEELAHDSQSDQGNAVKPEEIEQENDSISEINDYQEFVMPEEMDYEDAYLNACDACIMNDSSIPPVPVKENDIDFERN